VPQLRTAPPVARRDTTDVVEARAQVPHERPPGGGPDGGPPIKAVKPAGTPVHTEAPDALLARLATDPAHGLTEAEAEKRLARDGPNELPKPKGKSPIIAVLEQFAN